MGRIPAGLKSATDLVMSHFHGDPIPLPNAYPYQLSAQRVTPLCQTTRLWAKGPSHNMVLRREAVSKVLGREPPNGEGQRDGPSGGDVPAEVGRRDVTRRPASKGISASIDDGRR